MLPSPAQAAMLRAIQSYGDPRSPQTIRARQLKSTIAVLRREKWIESTSAGNRRPWAISRAGRAALRAYVRSLRHTESSILAWGAHLLAKRNRKKPR